MSSTASSQYYTVTVTSSKHASNGIIGNLPKSFGFRLWSSWANLLGGTYTSSKTGALAEFGANLVGRSFTNQYTSLQTWTGSSPLEITLPIQFFATTDAQSEVHKKILLLSKILMPSIDANNNQNRFFIPPGPAPFISTSTSTSSTGIQNSVGALSTTASTGDVSSAGTLSQIAGAGLGVAQSGASLFTSGINSTIAKTSAASRDNITVRLGNFMTLSTMILVGLDINYSGQMSYDGFPMAAEAVCTFRSLYTLTGNDLESMFNNAQGGGNVTLQSAYDAATSSLSSIGASISDIVSGGSDDQLTDEDEMDLLEAEYGV